MYTVPRETSAYLLPEGLCDVFQILDDASEPASFRQAASRSPSPLPPSPRAISQVISVSDAMGVDSMGGISGTNSASKILPESAKPPNKTNLLRKWYRVGKMLGGLSDQANSPRAANNNPLHPPPPPVRAPPVSQGATPDVGVRFAV